MTFAVRLAASAEDDLLRLLDHLLERANTAQDLDRAQEVIDALRAALLSRLASSPWSYRKAGGGQRSTRREIIIPCGATGYVALYEIEGPDSVVVLAVRHQREDDYH